MIDLGASQPDVQPFQLSTEGDTRVAEFDIRAHSLPRPSERPTAPCAWT